jgi:hypothetical protein
MKKQHKNTAKKVNKPEEGLTVSQSQQLDNTFERASTLDEKRLAAVQMIQSGLLPNTLATIDQLDDPETREKAIGGVAIIEYGRDENHTLDRLEWNARRAGQSCNIHMYMGLALKNILVDVTEDYRKMYSASDKTKLVDIQTTVEITRKHAEFGGMVKTQIL